MDIKEFRKEYDANNGISVSDLVENPILQFEKWFGQAVELDITEPNAMTLATVSETGCPRVRAVLLKHFDREGFVFYTNHESEKARHIAQNPQVALLFTWLPLERQIQIRGTATKISSAEAFKYFTTRPQGSQIGAWCSPQSRPVESRKFLEQKFQEMKLKFKEGKIPLPSFWGGYRVKPEAVEFWQGRKNRLHDRFEYTLDSNEKWKIKRLAP